MKLIPPVRVAVLFLLAFTAVGCTSVTFKQPVGKPSAEAAATLKGAWLLNVNDEGVVYINTGENGRVTIAVPEEDGEDWKFNKLKGTATTLDDESKAVYLNLRGEEKKDAPPSDRVAIFMVKVEDKQLLAWPINEDLIKKAIEKKELPGTVQGEHGTDVRVEANKDALDAYFKKHGTSLFKMDEPMVGRRIGKAEDKK